MTTKEHEMFLGIAESGARERLGRMALVIDDSSMSMTAARLRELVPTFCVMSLGEIVDALAAHELGALSEGTDEPDSAARLLVGLDITRVPVDDTMLFAENLLHSKACGTVYVMTPEQFSKFDGSLFDFVVR